ncbi:hypothetical protein TNCV_4449601 [Trichonephila clavipes]|nr:hypothetical protein TNCV_4449601 [Trichonephila clavipes]
MSGISVLHLNSRFLESKLSIYRKYLCSEYYTLMYTSLAELRNRKFAGYGDENCFSSVFSYLLEPYFLAVCYTDLYFLSDMDKIFTKTAPFGMSELKAKPRVLKEEKLRDGTFVQKKNITCRRWQSVEGLLLPRFLSCFTSFDILSASCLAPLERNFCKGNTWFVVRYVLHDNEAFRCSGNPGYRPRVFTASEYRSVTELRVRK